MTTYGARTDDDKCPFCEIASGRLLTPGVFWENEEFMAFLSTHPNTRGFSCLIPKRHFGSDILKMPDEALQRYILAAKAVASILEDFFQDVGRVGLIMEGTGIDHAHIKLVPMHGTEHLKHGEWRQQFSGKELWFERYEGWIASADGPKADREQVRELAEKIRTFIKRV
jgi:diadenosine tetraphosphate (Ap4A) HIT family hydrolase